MGQSQDLTRIKYGFESVYGTAVETTAVIGRVQSSDCNPGNNNYIYERGLGDGLNPVKTNLGIFDCGGSLTWNLTDWTFLQGWVGNISGSTLTTSDSYGVDSTDIKCFTLEDFNSTETNSGFIYSGCYGTDFSISGSIGQVVTCSANFVGQKSKYTATASSYTAPTQSSYTTIGGTWKWGTSPSTLSGVRDFSINFANSPGENRSIESRFINLPVNSGRSITGSLSIVMSSSLATTLIEDFYGQTATSGPVDGSTSTIAPADLEFHVDLANGTNNASIKLDQCSIDSISKPASLGGGIVVLTVNFTAQKPKDGVFAEWS